MEVVEEAEEEAGRRTRAREGVGDRVWMGRGEEGGAGGGGGSPGMMEEEDDIRVRSE